MEPKCCGSLTWGQRHGMVTQPKTHGMVRYQGTCPLASLYWRTIMTFKRWITKKGLLASLASCVNKESLLFQAECWYSFQIPRVILPNTMRIPSSSCWVFQPWRPSFFWHVQQPLKHIKSIHAPLRSSARCGSTRPNTWRPWQPGSPVMAAVWYLKYWDLLGPFVFAHGVQPYFSGIFLVPAVWQSVHDFQCTDG